MLHGSDGKCSQMAANAGNVAGVWAGRRSCLHLFRVACRPPQIKRRSPVQSQLPPSFDFIIVAAGGGSRAGGVVPKQFRRLGDRAVLAWSVAASLAHPGLHSLVVVGPPGEVDRVWQALGPLAGDTRLTVTEGGTTRTASVLAGLAARAQPAAAQVLIHDAARPGLTCGDIDALLAALSAAEAAAPALPVVDALKRTTSEGRVSQAVSRTDLWRVQTPQAFRAEVLARTLASIDTTHSREDDLDLVLAHGADVRLVAGAERLMKLTYPEDFERLERVLTPQAAPEVRVGHGFDVHAFTEGDGVWLCGVKIPHIARLEGHSDADAAWHALCDAIFGAMSAGDIGDHFPPSDPTWRGAASELFLKASADIAQANGWRITHVDVTVMCEAPRIKPHRLEMREATAQVLGLALDAVSVKATTTEQLGFLGRREGIAALATATLTRT